jgi:tetraacyldisaccharide 4'-kinase
MKAPRFWDKPGSLPGLLLAPLGWIYAKVTARCLARGRFWRAPVPVICIGNLTAGGAGKTPIVRDLADRLTQRGKRPAILTRGYGGRERGPLKVDPGHHRAADVGDEPLLLARNAPCWVAADRAAGAQAIAAAGARTGGGADMILMDDGLQNPDLMQDFRLVVVDGESGFGNGRALPAGPLRERVSDGLARADAIIVMGEDRRGLASTFPATIPVLHARLKIPDAPWLVGAKIAAFAGIGRPEKFRKSLEEAGAHLADFQKFADHYHYTPPDLAHLADRADVLGARLVTTEKDWVRLTPDWRARIMPIPVAVIWQDETALNRLLDRIAANV